MRKWALISGGALLAIFAFGNFVREFIASEPIRYFKAQPLGLLLVAATAVGGGLIMEGFCRLSPRWQHWTKLFGIGAVASCLTLFTGYLLYMIGGLSLHLGTLPGPVFVKGIAWPLGGAALLWFEFYRVSKCK
jgi:hypothetical protein